MAVMGYVCLTRFSATHSNASACVLPVVIVKPAFDSDQSRWPVDPPTKRTNSATSG